MYPALKHHGLLLQTSAGQCPLVATLALLATVVMMSLFLSSINHVNLPLLFQILLPIVKFKEPSFIATRPNLNADEKDSYNNETIHSSAAHTLMLCFEK